MNRATRAFVRRYFVKRAENLHAAGILNDAEYSVSIKAAMAWEMDRHSQKHLDKLNRLVKHAAPRGYPTQAG